MHTNKLQWKGWCPCTWLGITICSALANLPGSEKKMMFPNWNNGWKRQGTAQSYPCQPLTKWVWCQQKAHLPMLWLQHATCMHAVEPPVQKAGNHTCMPPECQATSRGGELAQGVSWKQGGGGLGQRGRPRWGSGLPCVRGGQGDNRAIATWQWLYYPPPDFVMPH